MSTRTTKSPVSSVSPQLPKIGMIFLGRRRPGFDMEWGGQQEEKARSFLSKAGFPVIQPEKAIDDISMRRAVAVCKENGAQVVVLFQGTMGDGRLAPTLAQLWPDPIVLWATTEKQDGDMISACTLVGAHCWGSVLRQMGHSFEIVYGDPASPATQKRFTEAARMAATVRALRTLRLGLIGGQAPGYYAMGGDLFAIYRGLGAQTQTYSLIEFSNVLNELTKGAVAEDVQKVKALGIPHKDTTDEDLPMASRLYLTMRSFMDNERLDALTVRCWPEMPNVFGQWPYLGIARLVDEGRAVACEGDAEGALSAWIGESLGLGRCYLTDWLEHDSKTITVWHGGAAPMSLCAPAGKPGGSKIARHFNIKKPAVVEATLRENMPVTLCRFWRCDGQYYLTAREGQTIKPKRHLMGTNGLARLDNQDPHAWFDELCHNGMPHHLCIFEGHSADLLKRLARALGHQFI
jgi:L-fucose isomerase-like protein